VKRCFSAALLLGLLVFTVPGRAGAASPGTGAAGPVQLISQTPWVKGAGPFQLHLAISAKDPARDRLEVLVFGQLYDRSDFQAAVKGRVNGYSYYHPVVPLSRLAPDPAGGVDVTIPVNQPAPPGTPFSSLQISAGSGVYPVQVQLAGPNGAPEGDPMTVFLVYSGANNSLPPLSVNLVVPFDSPPAVSASGRVLPPGPAEADRLARLAEALNADANVPASILADPMTLSAIASGAAAATAGSTVDRAILSNLAGSPQDGLIETLPATYAPVALGDLDAAGLAGEVGTQIAAGASVINNVFGGRPTNRTWVVDGPLTGYTLQSLAAQGVENLVVPDSDLSALPAYATETTFAQRTALSYDGTHLSVLAADPGITADFTSTEPAVLAANHMLAELAMIQTETPGVIRGVVALPPADWSVSPDFVNTLLAGLSGNPLLRAVTTSQAFTQVPVAKGDLERFLANPQPGPSAAAAALNSEAKLIQGARQDLSALGSLLPGRPDQLNDLTSELLIAESSVLSGPQRAALLARVRAAYDQVQHQINLPPPTSITLTANQGQVPITILSSSTLRPRVQLELTSQRLIFQAFRPPGGHCSVPTPTKEICTFDLLNQNTTLKVPVESRSSGVFPLIVELWSPDHSLRLGYERDTVRSTAVSGVGIVLIAVAVLGLAIWWARDVRRGRRPKGMVPAPGAEVPPATDHPNGNGRKDIGPTRAMSPIGDGDGPSRSPGN
jgi:hypothetical protein